MAIRCITFNLKGLSSGWFESRGRVVRDGLAALEPDLLLFQEAAVRSDPRLYHQSREIGRACGLDYGAFLPYGTLLDVMSSHQEGLATFSRWPILDTRIRRLPPGNEFPPDSRVVLYAVIDSPEGPVLTVNLHLSWRGDEASLRLVQLGMVINELTGCGAFDPGARTILAGDLNATERELAILLVKKRLQDCFRAAHPENPGYTWVRANPIVAQLAGFRDRRLDYLFCSKDARIRRAEVVLDSLEPVPASDHFAVLAEIEWAAEAGSRAA